MDQQPSTQNPAQRRRVILLVAAGFVVAAIGGALVGVLLARGQDPRPATASPSPTAVTPTPSPQPSPTETVQSPASLSTQTFIMPSRNIGCAFFDALRCDILSGLNPTPTGNCELDWTGLTLDPQGTAAPQCAGDTVFNPEAPVLHYGQTWSLAGITCESRETGLRCSNPAGSGFELARADWDTF